MLPRADFVGVVQTHELSKLAQWVAVGGEQSLPAVRRVEVEEGLKGLCVLV